MRIAFEADCGERQVWLTPADDKCESKRLEESATGIGVSNETSDSPPAKRRHFQEEPVFEVLLPRALLICCYSNAYRL
jgi:hypothetical protein